MIDYKQKYLKYKKKYLELKELEGGIQKIHDTTTKYIVKDKLKGYKFYFIIYDFKKEKTELRLGNMYDITYEIDKIRVNKQLSYYYYIEGTNSVVFSNKDHSLIVISLDNIISITKI